MIYTLGFTKNFLGGIATPTPLKKKYPYPYNVENVENLKLSYVENYEILGIWKYMV